MKEVVDEYGIVWLVAAGNEGPALSTLHTPCFLSEDVMIGEKNQKVTVRQLLEAYCTYRIRNARWRNEMRKRQDIFYMLSNHAFTATKI